MVDVSKLVKKSIKNLTTYVHGGNVWEAAQISNMPVNQLLDFSISTSPTGAPKPAVEAIRQHIDLIHHYPDLDHEWLLETFAKFAEVKAENIVSCNGSTELIYLFAEVFLGKEYEALIPVPSFSEYKAAIERAGGNMVFLGCDPKENFRLDVQELEKSVTSKTRIIFLCNPNSPTGQLYEKDDVLEVIKFAAEKNIMVFLDEDYIDFVVDGKRYSMAQYVNEYENLFILRTLTKFFGLAGARIGFGIASPYVAKILTKAKMPWSVNSLAMFGAAEAVQDEQFIKKTRLLVSSSKKEMMELFKEISWLKVYPSETNFLLIQITKADLTSTKLREGLLKKGILIRDCKDFDGLSDKFFRVTVRRPEENKKLIQQIKSFKPAD
ncbi:MAG: histidinol-phosphate transaminase [Candidatus Bathyarchaeota archaeon]|nr:histidinol-phosphate transaminase [Candidatus Bathyarchaeota archaeon]